jgi:hypothetical protein
LEIRPVKKRCHLSTQTIIFLVAAQTYNLTLFSIRRDVLAQRVVVLEKLAGEFLIDDRHRRGMFCIRGTEIAPLQHLDSHGGEVSVAHDQCHGLTRLCVGTIGDRNLTCPQLSSEQGPVGESDRPDAGDLGDLLTQGAIEALQIFRARQRRKRTDGNEQEILRVESRSVR